MSDRQIAEHVGVSAPMVGKHRKELETTVKDLQSESRTGRDGRTINENGLYQHYGTFAAYVDERWGMTVRNAQRLINAATIVERLQSSGECDQLVALPTHESQVRHLTKVDPEDVPKVWGGGQGLTFSAGRG